MVVVPLGTVGDCAMRRSHSWRASSAVGRSVPGHSFVVGWPCAGRALPQLTETPCVMGIYAHMV